MFKVEDIQSYGKEHFEQCVASATTVQHGLQAIASAYGDYTKKSFEEHQVLRREAFRREVAGQGNGSADRFRPLRLRDLRCGIAKIAGLYSDLAKQAFKPVETIVSEVLPAAN
ncbi:phasin family protein [Streptomyces sp. L7]